MTQKQIVKLLKKLDKLNEELEKDFYECYVQAMLTCLPFELAYVLSIPSKRKILAETRTLFFRKFPELRHNKIVWVLLSSYVDSKYSMVTKVTK